MKRRALHMPSLLPIFCGVLFALAGLYIVFFNTPTPAYAIVAWASLFDDAIPVYLVFTISAATLNLVYVFLGSRGYDRERATLYNFAGVILAVVIVTAL